MQENWFQKRVQQSLEDRIKSSLLRTSSTFEPLRGCTIRNDGRVFINFGSNDYLGLAADERIAALVQKAFVTDVVQRWGSGASPLVTGRTLEHEQLELRIANWKRAEASLTFSSGYATNVSVVSALAKQQDYVFSDELNHASLIDGCRLSRSKITVYPHNNLEALEHELQLASRSRTQDQGFWIISDTVFSMEGDVANIEQLMHLAELYRAGLILDEAHAVGIYGDRGQGLVDFHCSMKIPVICIGTMSKALGSIGGYVAANASTIEYLRQFARGYIYSTAMPALVARASRIAIDILDGMRDERMRLRQTAAKFRSELSRLGLLTMPGDSPICPIYLTAPQLAIDASARLKELGFFVPAIRPPTVPEGKSMLRISLSAAHEPSQIDGLLTALKSLAPSLASPCH